jgi:hypothetical protein
MEGSVLSFLKAEWKVSDTGSAQCWTSSFVYVVFFSNVDVVIKMILNQSLCILKLFSWFWYFVYIDCLNITETNT